MQQWQHSNYCSGGTVVDGPLPFALALIPTLEKFSIASVRQSNAPWYLNITSLQSSRKATYRPKMPRQSSAAMWFICARVLCVPSTTTVIELAAFITFVVRAFSIRHWIQTLPPSLRHDGPHPARLTGAPAPLRSVGTSIHPQCAFFALSPPWQWPC